MYVCMYVSMYVSMYVWYLLLGRATRNDQLDRQHNESSTVQAEHEAQKITDPQPSMRNDIHCCVTMLLYMFMHMHATTLQYVCMYVYMHVHVCMSLQYLYTLHTSKIYNG